MIDDWPHFPASFFSHWESVFSKPCGRDEKSRLGDEAGRGRITMLWQLKLIVHKIDVGEALLVMTHSTTEEDFFHAGDVKVPAPHQLKSRFSYPSASRTPDSLAFSQALRARLGSLGVVSTACGNGSLSPHIWPSRKEQGANCPFNTSTEEGGKDDSSRCLSDALVREEGCKGN